MIFIFLSVIDVYSQSLDTKIKSVIYEFIRKEDNFRNDLDWCNQEELNTLIYIEPLKSTLLDVDVYLFRVKISPSRTYLLVSQEERTFIVGRKGKEMFDEMKALYDFLELSEKEKLDFLKDTSESFYFIYENNLDVKNSNRIKVYGKDL